MIQVFGPDGTVLADGIATGVILYWNGTDWTGTSAISVNSTDSTIDFAYRIKNNDQPSLLITPINGVLEYSTSVDNHLFFTTGGVQRKLAFTNSETFTGTSTFADIAGASLIYDSTNEAFGFGLAAVSTAFVKTGASTSSKTALLIPAGVDVSAAADGSIWFNGTNLKIRVGGTDKTVVLI